MRRHLLAFSLTVAAIAGLGAQGPTFQVDRLWPKPMGHSWILGSVTGVAVDAQDHIWVVHRGADSLTVRTEAGLNLTPPGSELCCMAAPFVLEFDQSGAVVSNWGGPGQGFDWPVSPGGITVDDKGNVWIAAAGVPELVVLPRGGGAGAAAEEAGAGRGGGRAGGGAAGGGAQAAGGGAAGGGAAGGGAAGGGAAGGGAAGGGGGQGRGGRGPAGPPRPADAHILKFTKTGQFVMQIGKAGDAGDKDSKDKLNRPADLAVDTAANEVYVADGGTSQRIVVFDATTGAYKRHWPGHGSDFARLTCVTLSKDGQVYVCDRKNNRIQVFKKDGTFVREVVIAKETLGNGSVWDVAFSQDAAQQFAYVADGQNEKVWVLRRATLEPAGSFGGGGRWPGTFYGVGSVAVDSKGMVYTGETFEGKRIQKFLRK
jgi:hypothetical protein